MIPFYVDEGITPAYAGKRRYHYMLCYPLWDHPRVCGEKCHSRLRAASAEGSPPRMRGKEAAGKLCPVGGGITPAYAGKRQSGELHLQQARDHPRICGEKPCAHIPAVCYIGSPPRMRGKAESHPCQSSLPGITPAYAGKRVYYSRHQKSTRDHPRVCGEKLKVILVKVAFRGSPPRMRGKVFGFTVLR